MGALDGITILDLSRAVPGPYATMLLSDMGAEVLCVEAPSKDPRAVGQRAPTDDPERTAAFNALRRNKRSICIDLKNPEGKALLLELARRADVLVEGFRPGVMQRLGLDWPTLSSLNPRLIYLSVSGYGQDGPYAKLAGHDVNFLAVAGALGLTSRGGERPAIPGMLVADTGGGLMAALAVALALYAREKSGRGQYLDLSISDAVVSMMARAMSKHFETGEVPVPGQGRNTGALPQYDVYVCADGKQVAVAALEPWLFEQLARALDVDAKLEREAMRAAFAKRFLERPRDAWLTVLHAADACAAAVYAVDELAADPHHRARNMFLELQHSRFGSIRQVGVQPRLSATPGAARSVGCVPGAHTRQVLAELGLEPQRIEALVAAGAVEQA